jgi:hypothetical protein
MSNSKENIGCEVFKSNRGALKLFVEGFTYNKNKCTKHTFYWYCELYHNNISKCNATINTIVNVDGQRIITKRANDHNHGPEPLRKDIADFKETLKSASRSSDKKSCNIVQDAKSTVDQIILQELPSTSALKQVVYREKKKNAMSLVEPDSIDFELDTANTQIMGDNFVIKDRVFDKNKRILLMSTTVLIKTLSKSDYWILDGTFKIAPLIFKQLYTIHGNVFKENKKTFPLLFCLCTHKDKKTYDMMFELIVEYGVDNEINIHPKVCILDFEKAAILSLRSNFENIILQGCHFHFAQIIYRYFFINTIITKNMFELIFFQNYFLHNRQ